MKRIVLLLAGLALCAGCATRYNITLQNGQVVTSFSKPVLDQSRLFYTYTTMATIPAGNVREIAPASMKETKDSRYLSVPTPDR